MRPRIFSILSLLRSKYSRQIDLQYKGFPCGFLSIFRDQSLSRYNTGFPGRMADVPETGHSEGRSPGEGGLNAEQTDCDGGGARSETSLLSAVSTTSNMSRRAKKRMLRDQRRHTSRSRNGSKKRKTDDEKGDRELNFQEKALKDTEYYFQNGLRKVYPYFFTFKTYAKGRWVGQKLVDIFANEFKAYKKETYSEAISVGRVTVNGEKIDLDYIVKESDFIENRIHRHELAVVGADIPVVEDSELFLVVDKPSSIPIHPCGRYRHNSLTYILAIEKGYRNLRSIYRLDRLTSGVFIFCKTDGQTRIMQEHIKKRKVEKTYLARVNGQFPSEPTVCEGPIDHLTMKIGLFKVGPKGKEAKTSFQRLSYNGKTSVVSCKPHTGRTHQIRVHLQYLGYPIVNDPLYNTPIWGTERGKGGNFGKPEEQLVEELIAHHTAERYDESDGGDATLSTPSTHALPRTGDTTITTLSTQVLPTAGDTTTTTLSTQALPTAGDTTITTLSTQALPTAGDTTITIPSSRALPVAEDHPTPHQAPGQAPSDTASTSDIHIDNPLQVSSLTRCEGATANAPLTEGDDRPGLEPSKLVKEPTCDYCKRQYADPRPDELIMYLHALSYQGPGWSFSTDMPAWAQDDYEHLE